MSRRTPLVPALLAACLLTAAGLAHAAEWRGSEMPEPIVAGVENGQMRYVCRAEYSGGVHPGKTVDGRCNITYGGHEIPMERYQMLYARGHWGRWDRRNFNGALIAGHENNGEPLFLCRTDHNGAMHPGKVVNGRCNIGYGGNEISQPDFELYYEDR